MPTVGNRFDAITIVYRGHGGDYSTGYLEDKPVVVDEAGHGFALAQDGEGFTNRGSNLYYYVRNGRWHMADRDLYSSERQDTQFFFVYE